MEKGAHRIILAVFIIVIFILSYIFIEDNLCISILGDEFGYWSAAAFFLNKPWQSLTATNSYYGWGYGLILTPVLYIFNRTPTIMYHAAIFLNAIFLCLILVISYKCTLRLSIGKNKILSAFIAGCVTLFPSNFFSVYNTMPEILLQLLYWIMVWCVLLITEDNNIEHTNKRKFRLFLVLIAIAVYMSCVHQRTSGLIIDVIVFSICFWRSTKENKMMYFIKLLCAMILLLVISSGIKSFYMNWIYLNANHSSNGDGILVNDFDSVVNGVSFSYHSIRGIIISAIGKVYYSCVSSALFGGAGGLLCVMAVMRRKSNRKLFYLFILLGWLQAVGIAAIWMPGGFKDRTDILIYGRYIEYVLGPLIMVGLLGICEKSISYKEVFFLMVMQSIFTLVTSRYIAHDSINTNLGNIFTIAGVFQNFSNVEAIFICNFLAILLFVIFFLIRNRKYVNKLGFILLFCLEIRIAANTYQEVILPWTRSVSDNVNVINVYKEERGTQSNLYIYNGGIGGKMIQFLTPNEECILVNEVDNIEKNNLIITRYNKEILNDITEQYEVLYQNKIVILWRK